MPTRADSELSWTAERSALEAKNLDITAVNPHARSDQDTRSPEELLDIIEAKGREVAAAAAELRTLTRGQGEDP